jgi:hypothetical protein
VKQKRKAKMPIPARRTSLLETSIEPTMLVPKGFKKIVVNSYPIVVLQSYGKGGRKYMHDEKFIWVSNREHWW